MILTLHFSKQAAIEFIILLTVTEKRMKIYPAKPKKRKLKLVTDKFDKSKLSTFDLNLLDAFHERREKYEHLIKESTIIYHKKTCPGCGYPTFENNDFFTTCIICL